MKTLANARDKREIIERLGAIRSTSERRWGKMTSGQMICHLSDAFRSSMGERDVSSSNRWIPRVPLKWVTLWMPIQWPHGFPAPAEWDSLQRGTRRGNSKMI